MDDWDLICAYREVQRVLSLNWFGGMCIWCIPPPFPHGRGNWQPCDADDREDPANTTGQQIEIIDLQHSG